MKHFSMKFVQRRLELVLLTKTQRDFCGGTWQNKAFGLLSYLSFHAISWNSFLDAPKMEKATILLSENLSST